MAGDWLKIRKELPEDPAVVEIAKGLGINEDEVVGKLVRLWAWADSHARRGKAHGIASEWIDNKVRCANFSQEMMRAGWLKVCDTGVTFPHFDRHMGESAKKRADAALRQRRSRASRKLSQKSCDNRATREEKRREEKSNNTPQPPEELTGGLLKNTTPRKPKSTSTLPPGFLRFWQAWPKHFRKAGRTKCSQIWKRSGCEPIADHVVAMVEASKWSPDWTNDQGAFIPAPAVWLNQGRWDTDPADITQATGIDAELQNKFARIHFGKEAIQLTPREQELFNQWLSRQGGQ